MPIRTILIILFGLGFLYGLFTVGAPFLLALVSAIFLDPLIRFIMKTFRINRILAATVICSFFTIVLLVLFYLMGLKIFTEMVAFWRRLPFYINEIHHLFILGIENSRLLAESLPPEMAAQFEQGLASVVHALNGALQSILSKISGSFFNLAKIIPDLFIFFIVYIVAVYLFCYSMSSLQSSFLSLFEEKSRDKVKGVLAALHSAVFGFIRAQFIISFFIYVVTALGLFLLGADYPLAMALIVVLVDILPILGTGTVLIPWSVYQFATGDMFTGVGLISLFLLITVGRKVIEPKILSDAIGISPLSALISLYVGYQLAGVVGLILGPIVVIIYQAMYSAGLLRIRFKLE